MKSSGEINELHFSDKSSFVGPTQLNQCVRGWSWSGGGGGLREEERLGCRWSPYKVSNFLSEPLPHTYFCSSPPLQNSLYIVKLRDEILLIIYLFYRSPNLRMNFHRMKDFSTGGDTTKTLRHHRIDTVCLHRLQSVSKLSVCSIQTASNCHSLKMQQGIDPT